MFSSCLTLHKEKGGRNARKKGENILERKIPLISDATQGELEKNFVCVICNGRGGQRKGEAEGNKARRGST